jgi:hypothetical protein
VFGPAASVVINAHDLQYVVVYSEGTTKGVLGMTSDNWLLRDQREKWGSLSAIISARDSIGERHGNMEAFN